MLMDIDLYFSFTTPTLFLHKFTKELRKPNAGEFIPEEESSG